MADAWLYWVGAPRDTVIEGLDLEGGFALHRLHPLTIGRTPESQIRVVTPMIGGRRNSVVRAENGNWRYLHLGHAIPIFHNDKLLPRLNAEVPVAHGDVFGPQSVDGGRLAFLFLETAGLERSQVVPHVELAVQHAFPDRAATMMGEVGSWFVSEPMAEANALARVLHCRLCGSFRRSDAVVLVEALRLLDQPGRIQYQVLDDFEGSLGPPTDPVFGFCERCLADPAATLRRADDADRLRVDLGRALDASQIAGDIRAELERRFAQAQPRRVTGVPCALCAARENTLRGCSGTICGSCLEKSSAVRNIRG